MGFILQIINGLSLGSIYALVALGYTMVYGIALLINFAHGEIIMIGAYTVVFSTTLCLAKIGAPLWLSIIPAVILCTILGLFIERVAYRPLRNSPRISNLITAIGVSLFLQNIVMLFFGAGAMSTQSLFKTQIVKLGSLEIPFISLITIVITAILTVALQYFMTKTKMGKALIATSEDSKAAELVGINVDNAMVLTFGIGSALAGVAAVLYMGTYAQAQPLMGSMLGIKAFTAAVIGGIGLVPGAVIGGLLLGIVEALTRAYLSSKLADAIVFSILIIVLLIKPTGLLGKNVKEKV
ncbi:ABC transporter permease [Peptoniphilus lacrimalis DNF00528]|uniref:Branched-chain amino acid ABC transporter, permease protein n=1 Tax=Peptoniphilus lacrimalis 315-B TaxID=596330 RepID=D1VT05_9FIRM|nr:branched-chain amino acid ABC transporter permease [Peptoniphilus lacrimalis]EFA90319.1 branched-chain amino acid ABC transporter, permease protein [Peptoniphilus lacrimalis 315-B]KGF31345.1 ABC transporter permease [Peptoniphilus lacrimalis DNF00528]